MKAMIGFTILFVLIGCRSGFQNKLANIINQDCQIRSTSVCKIKLKDETDFKWDKMYIFGPWTTSKSVANTIGFNYNGDDIYNDTQRVLFTYGHRIAYEEDIDFLDGGSILFDNQRDTLFLSKQYYLPTEAIFTVNNHSENGRSEFYLTRIKPAP